MIRVLLLDDQSMLRMGFRLILSAEPGIEVVGEAGDGATAVRMAAAPRPDVVLMGGEAVLAPSATRRLLDRFAALATVPPREQILAGLTERGGPDPAGPIRRAGFGGPDPAGRAGPAVGPGGAVRYGAGGSPEGTRASAGVA